MARPLEVMLSSVGLAAFGLGACTSPVGTTAPAPRGEAASEDAEPAEDEGDPKVELLTPGDEPRRKLRLTGAVGAREE